VKLAVARADQPSVSAPNVETIEELFAALESPLLHYALRLIPDRETAEETVQEAFMKLHANFEQVVEPRRWLYRVVHNAAVNHRRTAGKLISLEATAPDRAEAGRELVDPQPLPDEQIAHWETIGLVRLGLANLDARSREVVRLKFDENLSYQDIGRRLGLTGGNVGYVLHHALKTIAAELSKNGVMP
jgi:RNA polymerase sigma factor (sigma-70 family)